MDGYAVRAADVASASDDAPTRLDVVGTLAAGTSERPEVGPGQAVRIMTGAPMPPGADAIVMVERTDRDGDDGVLVRAAVPAGNHIRRVGEDVEVGDVVVTAGTVLTPAHLGVLASVGRETVSVRRPPRVGVLSTGDELVTAPAPLARPDPGLEPPDAAGRGGRQRVRGRRPRHRPRRRGRPDLDPGARRPLRATPSSPAAGSAWATSTW